MSVEQKTFAWNELSESFTSDSSNVGRFRDKWEVISVREEVREKITERRIGMVRLIVLVVKNGENVIRFNITKILWILVMTLLCEENTRVKLTTRE